MKQRTTYSPDYEKALEVGRPPNIKELFPNSKAMLVSGKVIDRAVLKKGDAMTIAANGRSNLVIRGSLLAAQRANAAIIIEIARSESAYCITNYWNLSRYVDTLCNELGITVPVAIHADHFQLKDDADIEASKVIIPSIFEAGCTSVAIDASLLPDEKNLATNILLSEYVPKWSGYETEIGEIKGKSGISTPEEAVFLAKGLIEKGLSPDWIAVNNGTTHGLEQGAGGIDVDLTFKIHEALAAYGLSGAQHGTSGNSSERLREVATKTKTTKANVATALQMLAWGVEVNEYGNAKMDGEGNFTKVKGQGVTEELWEEMVAYAKKQDWKKGNVKKLNLPFENKIMSQTREVRERCSKAVEDFVFDLLVNVFEAKDTAPLAIEQILSLGSHDMGPKAK